METHRDHSRHLSDFDALEELRFQTHEFQSTLKKQLAYAPQADSIASRFKALNSNWEKFCSDLINSIQNQKQKSRELMQIRASRKKKQKQLAKKIADMKEQQQHSTRHWTKTLLKLKNMWSNNLSQMETTLDKQRKGKARMEKEYLKQIEEIEKEMEEVLEERPPVPNLDLNNIQATPAKPSSVRSSSSLKVSDDEVVSNRSAFSHVTEEPHTISSRPKPKKRNIPPLPPMNVHSRDVSYISEENVSVEFEKLMADIEAQAEEKINPNGISMEKSIGGWKSEYESEAESVSMHINPEEIKKALDVLKKANLLGQNEESPLVKIAEAMKDPECSGNLNLILQLININKKPSRKSQHRKSSGKPPTPTSGTNWKRRLQINSLGEGASEFQKTSPKGAFVFPEEQDFSRTVQSNENPLSSRQKQDGDLEDVLEGLSEHEELHHVRLEDLLNVESLGNSMGLKSASFDVAAEAPKEQESKLQVSTRNNQDRKAKLDTQEFREKLKNLQQEKYTEDYSEVVSPSVNVPTQKQSSSTNDYQSTGISSTKDTSGLRSRIALKTAGSEASQKINSKAE